MSWMNEFYHGNIHPQEEEQPIMRELIQLQKEYRQRMERVLLRLDESSGYEVQGLLEERNAVSALEIEDAYIRGMRMGARMAVELLIKENQPSAECEAAAEG